MLAKLSGTDNIAALYIVNFDRLPYINSTYGSGVGDRLIQQFSRRLTVYGDGNCFLARIGGCKFAFFNSNVTDLESVQEFSNQIMRLAISPITIENFVFYLQIKIGICVYPAGCENLTKLLANAESTLSNSRYLWKNNCSCYTKELDEIAVTRSVMETSLRYALERNELLLHYQPIVDLQSGDLSGVEALIRWNHRKPPTLPH